MELGDRVIDVLVIQDGAYFAIENAVQLDDICGESGLRIDFSRDPDFHEIVMTVSMRISAGAEDTRILFGGPLRPPIAVRGRESNLTSEVRQWHEMRSYGRTQNGGRSGTCRLTQQRNGNQASGLELRTMRSRRMQSPQQCRTGASKILIVEDHLDSREALRALFEAFGFEVCEAFDGRDAIVRAAVERPALILMDIMMPGIDGFDAARAIRSLPGCEDIPIIAVTAMDGGQELAFQAGMSDYVRKPVDIHGLLAKVSGWLKPSAA